MPIRLVNPIDRKRKIVYALSRVPMTHKRLGEVVGTYKLNSLVADLKASGVIWTNRSTGKLELATEIMVYNAVNQPAPQM